MQWHRFLQARPRAYLGRGDGSRRALALTFDDGPGRATPALLDALRELQVSASFFCTGAAASQHPRLIEQLLREGHEVGNHSQTHADARGFGARDWFAREVAPAAVSLREAGLSENPRLFRPPTARSTKFSSMCWPRPATRWWVGRWTRATGWNRTRPAMCRAWSNRCWRASIPARSSCCTTATMSKAAAVKAS
ncbi:polysaccharide deacetylase family protein [Lysobacter gummosus]|uniref:polysaccharide deacetylase family protein n=1 Tax=Lysobacter gummosus TaxID=262324 RepID=UPI003632C639